MSEFAKVTLKNFLEKFKNFNTKTQSNEKRKETYNNKTAKV